MATARKPWEHAKTVGSETDPLAARFVSSLDFDQRLYKCDIRGSLAHARMLAQVDLITADEFAQIERGLLEIEREIDEQGPRWPGWRIELEDVHMCLEAALIDRIGEAGRKLHTGRSRNDQVALDLVLWLHEAQGALEDKTWRLLAALVELADRDGRLVMPGYTHLQRAQPVLVGAELFAWADRFHATLRRLRWALQIDIDNPLGSGAIAGSALPLDRQVTGSWLRPDASWTPSENSIATTASRDNAVDFVYCLAMTAMWLSRWAEQWVLYASNEFNFIALDAACTTGSSMMPQKQNPDMLELVRGKCGGVYGHLVALLTLLKGLPVGYSRDLQEDKRHVFAAYDSVCDCLDMATRLVQTTRFNQVALEAALDRGYLDATSLAEYLVTRGVPFRTAHQQVGQLVQTCEREGLGALRELPLHRINEACGDDICDQDVYDWLGAHNVVRRYQTAGNAGTAGFEEQSARWRSRLAGRPCTE